MNCILSGFFLLVGFYLILWDEKQKPGCSVLTHELMYAFFDQHEDQEFLTSVFTIQSFEIQTCYHDLKHN